MSTKTALFEPGMVFSTPGARATAPTETLELCVQRHLHGDWGDIDPAEKDAVNDAVSMNLRIISVYGAGDDALLVMTESDRRTTIILRRAEY